MIRRFRLGFSKYFSGLRSCFTTWGLLKIAILPMILNGVCLFFLLYYSLDRVPQIAAWVVDKPQVWYQYGLYYFTVGMSALALIFLSIFSVWILSGLLAFPFYDRLSEKVLAESGLLPSKQGGIKLWLKQSMRNFKTTLRKTLWLLAAAGFMLITALLPGLGVVGIVVGVIILTFDAWDYSFDHFGWTFGERVKFCRINGLEFLGFTFGLTLTTFIPMFSILLMPGQVVAGSQLIAAITKPETKGTPREGPHSPETRR